MDEPTTAMGIVMQDMDERNRQRAATLYAEFVQEWRPKDNERLAYHFERELAFMLRETVRVEVQPFIKAMSENIRRMQFPPMMLQKHEGAK